MLGILQSDMNGKKWCPSLDGLTVPTVFASAMEYTLRTTRPEDRCSMAHAYRGVSVRGALGVLGPPLDAHREEADKRRNWAW